MSQVKSTTESPEYCFATKAIHEGQEADPTTGALITPIYQTSTFVLEELGVNKGYQYARTHNPTRSALEECLASLENAKYCLASASGLSAAATVINLLSAGAHVIVGEDVYGGVYRLFEKVFSRYGLTFTYIDGKDINAIESAITPQTKLVWLESPTNPLLRLADLRKVGELTKSRGLIFAVDNTFATPYFQRPIELGADVVIHSTTKYISGHSDIIGGAIITSNDELYEVLKFHNNAVGAVPGPLDCFLALRGVKTLALRMKEHQNNAFAVARFLEQHPGVESVFYPGLTSHPQHELACEQMKGFGGVVACVVKGGIDTARSVVSNTKLFQLAESLGGVKSLICHPASMTHAPIPKEVREPLGIVDGLIRLSVGIEEAADLIRDLDNVLPKAKTFATSKERELVNA
ncbi:MAG: PLP-dependent aspartate aminotransferase family protein [Candidatus Obscuribacterales bacterium]|nr:PLP-dependent aspartate aminotransferase family protein [Candidatus Obscuribacterales bacterium]